MLKLELDCNAATVLEHVGVSVVVDDDVMDANIVIPLASVAAALLVLELVIVPLLDKLELLLLVGVILEEDVPVRVELGVEV